MYNVFESSTFILLLVRPTPPSLTPFHSPDSQILCHPSFRKTLHISDSSLDLLPLPDPPFGGSVFVRLSLSFTFPGPRRQSGGHLVLFRGEEDSSVGFRTRISHRPSRTKRIVGVRRGSRPGDMSPVGHVSVSFGEDHRVRTLILLVVFPTTSPLSYLTPSHH